MADRHSIVVRIVAGQVRSVAFCECCPPLTIEVRIYGSVEPQPDEACSPVDLNEDRSRDGLGEYRSQFFEPDDE